MPESLRVIEMHGMSEFMDEYMANQFFIEKHELRVQADGALPGATAPACAL